jgi:hypothetical protein
MNWELFQQQLITNSQQPQPLFTHSSLFSHKLLGLEKHYLNLQFIFTKFIFLTHLDTEYFSVYDDIVEHLQTHAECLNYTALRALKAFSLLRHQLVKVSSFLKS